MMHDLRPVFRHLASAARSATIRAGGTCGPLRVFVALVLVAFFTLPVRTWAQETIALPEADRVRPGTAEELFIVGELDGEEWEQFASVRGLAFDFEGRLIVPDFGNTRVAVVDSSGELLFEFGRAGEGPGEFGAPHGAVALADGTIVISDTPNQAHILFGPDGSYMGQTRFDFGSLSISGMRTRYPFGSEGFLYQSVQPFGETIYRIFLQPVTGGERRALLTFSPDDVENTGVSQTASGGIVVDGRVDPGARRVLQPNLRWGVLGADKMASATAVGYEIEVRTAEGEVETVITRPLAPREVTDMDREVVLARERERLLAGGTGGVSIAGREIEVPEADVREALDAVVFPERIPVIERMASDLEGRLWVQRVGATVGDEGPIDVLGPDGDYLFTVHDFPLPHAFGPDGLAAYLEAGEFDEPLIRVVRIPEGWR